MARSLSSLCGSTDNLFSCFICYELVVYIAFHLSNDYVSVPLNQHLLHVPFYLVAVTVLSCFFGLILLQTSLLFGMFLKRVIL